VAWALRQRVLCQRAGQPVQQEVAGDYRNPAVLPPGRILVVGSGQTGCQIAEELQKAGREVVLSCGRAPWLLRRLDGRGIVTWLNQTTFFDTPLAALRSPADRLVANLQATGRGGGHDLHYRTLQAAGVQLAGRFAGVDGHRAYFANDLADSVAFGDARYEEIRRLLTAQLAVGGRAAPELPDPPPFCADPPLALDLREVAAVIVTSGFRPDYASWVRFPAFDAVGSRSPATATAPWYPACAFAASTSCAPASPHCCSASARTPPSWRDRSSVTDLRAPAQRRTDGGVCAPARRRPGTATVPSVHPPGEVRRRVSILGRFVRDFGTRAARGPAASYSSGGRHHGQHPSARVHHPRRRDQRADVDLRVRL
jgi:hypothetical protein